jgi:hypothetical protein
VSPGGGRRLPGQRDTAGGGATRVTTASSSEVSSTSKTSKFSAMRCGFVDLPSGPDADPAADTRAGSPFPMLSGYVPDGMMYPAFVAKLWGTPPRPSRIFISYRRVEAGYPASWLYECLTARFNRDEIFKDINDIEPGEDFTEAIAEAVSSCEVLLALIGPRWLTVTDENGRRRLDNPNDYVRREIETALERDVRVIPVLIDGAVVPQAQQVPASLQKLAHLQAPHT